MKKLILLLAFAACAFGQGSSTIFMKALNAVATTQATNPLQNIGQASHLILVQETNAPAQTCSSDVFINVRIEASLDGTTWTPIGVPVTTTQTDQNGNLVGTGIAFGAFPFIRINAAGFNVGICLVTVEYSGTLYPPNPSSLSAVQSNFKVARAEINAGAGTYVVFTTPNGLGRIVIYGLVLVNESATSTPVSIAEKNVANCTAGQLQLFVDLHTTGLGAGQSLVIPQSSVPFFTGTATSNDTICITTTNTGVVYVAIVYRVE